MNKNQIERVETFLKDAESLYKKALYELEKDDIRDAAEKAWGAVVKSTAALILAKTGKELEGSRNMSKELDELATKDKEIKDSIVPRYYTRESSLHGQCFYIGICEPKEEIKRRIRETLKYIEDIRKLIY